MMMMNDDKVIIEQFAKDIISSRDFRAVNISKADIAFWLNSFVFHVTNMYYTFCMCISL